MMESLKSWIRVDPRCDFTLYNIPFGVFSTKSDPERKRRCCSAIGDYIIDLVALYENKLLIESDHGNVFNKPSLNSFMELNKTFWSNTRIQIIKLLLEESYRDIDGICIPDRRLRDNEELKRLTLLPLSSVDLHLPVDISDYTDFYSSREHAENVGSIFRGKNSVTGNCLQPNWLNLPVGYHGRSSTVVVSNTDVTRPCGQVLMEDGTPQLVPCRSLDFELELGYLIGGTPNKLGERIPLNQAEDRLFGVVLLNDWSARDVQRWEYVPLGPFTAKNFCTSISPWVVTMAALEPFRCCPSAGSNQTDPIPLPYLIDENYHLGAYDLELQVSLRPSGQEYAMVIGESNAKYLYWNIKQQLAHHSVTGCVMRPGDLLGTGTISGPTANAKGCLLEMTRDGTEVIELSFPKKPDDKHPNIIQRRYLEDGDELILTGFGQLVNGYRVGFGEVRGKILSANIVL